MERMKREAELGSSLQLITMAELVQRLRTDAKTIRRWIKADTFPAPFRLGPNRVGWRVADIEAWLKAKEASHG